MAYIPKIATFPTNLKNSKIKNSKPPKLVLAYVVGKIQSTPRLHCPLTELLDTSEYINEEQRPGWNFAHAQDNMNLRISRMFECIFFRLTRPNNISLKI